MGRWDRTKQRGNQLLALLPDEGEHFSVGIRVAELETRTGIPRNAVRRVLAMLEEENRIVQQFPGLWYRRLPTTASGGPRHLGLTIKLTLPIEAVEDPAIQRVLRRYG